MYNIGLESRGERRQNIDFLNIRIRLKWTLRVDAWGKNKLIRVFNYFSKCIIDGVMDDIVMPPMEAQENL